MTFTTLVVLTSTLAVPSATPPTVDVAAPAKLEAVGAVTATAERAAPAPHGERPHQFGVGGSVTASTRGAAGGIRYWFSDHIGVNMTAGWYRGYYQTTSGDRPSMIHASPAIMYMIGKPNNTREVDIRPFIGGGASYLRSRRPVLVPTGNIRMLEASGTGMHAFGGAEVTFKEAEQIALSGELIYYRLPVRLSNNSIDGFNYLVAVHFYLK